MLVLGAGGTLGEAWMSALLAGIEERTGVDFRRTEGLVGTSAGSIVAAWLVAGRRPAPPSLHVSDAPGRRGRRRAGASSAPATTPPSDAGAHWPGGGVLRGVAGAVMSTAAPLAPLALSAGAPGGAVARAALLAIAPEGVRTHDALAQELDSAGARFDGRLRVCCVDRASGRRVVFGAPGAPRADVGAAVSASCAVPGMYRPVRIGGREYVDGGVWSVTNMDAATVAHDTQVLCLSPLGGLHAAGVPPLTAALRLAFRGSEAVESAALRRRGASVRVVVPEGEAAHAIGVNAMDPGPRSAVARAGYRQGLAIGSES